MKIFLSRVYLETIMIIGIWSRNYFLWYTYIQAIDPRKDISDLIYGEKTLYTIPKSEVVYYTPVQSRTQSCRINSQRGNTEVLPLATALKWSPKEVSIHLIIKPQKHMISYITKWLLSFNLVLGYLQV